MTDEPAKPAEVKETHLHELLAHVPLMDEMQTALSVTHAPAWLVGGCVRDLLLGRMPVDIDITSQQPEPLARRFAGLTGGTLVTLDPERGIWRVAMRGRINYDFCGFRDHDIIGDLRGRDFTINAIALRLPEPGQLGGLLDPFHGMQDLGAGVLRLVSPHALRDDPARILRAFRFVADLHLTIEDDTWQSLRKEADRLPLVAPERLLTEWWKLCAGAHAAAAVARMNEARVLSELFPELEVCKGVTQNLYHHLDVWEHLLLAMTLMVRCLREPAEILRDLEPHFAPLLEDEHRRARLVFIALIHDLGKPATRTMKDGKVHFYRHEIEGAEMAGRVCRRLHTSREDQTAVTTIIRRHLRPLFLLHAAVNDGPSRRAMGLFFEDAGDYALEVMLLALADKSASRGEASDPEIVERMRALYRELLTYQRQIYLPAIASPLLTGRDLTQHFRVSPGPQVGQLLRQARRLQIQGRLTSRDEALRWAEEQLGEMKNEK